MFRAFVDAGDEILRHRVVVAAFVCAEHRVQDAALQLDAADDQPVDAPAFEDRFELGARPDVVPILTGYARAGYGRHE